MLLASSLASKNKSKLGKVGTVQSISLPSHINTPLHEQTNCYMHRICRPLTRFVGTIFESQSTPTKIESEPHWVLCSPNMKTIYNSFQIFFETGSWVYWPRVGSLCIKSFILSRQIWFLFSCRELNCEFSCKKSSIFSEYSHSLLESL